MILKLKSQFAPLINLDPHYQRPLRVVIALAYTALLTLVLVQSSMNPVVGPVAPRDHNLAWEVFLTSGHLVGFALLVFLIWSALATVAPPLRSLIVAVIFACLLGLITEFLQSFVPDRSASLFDLACDWGVAFSIAYLIYRQLKSPAQFP
jgi:VanZ family protein